MKVPLLPRWMRWALVAVVSGVILYFSVIQSPGTPSGAGPFWDKKLHFAAYGGLTVVYAYATARYRRRPIYRAVGVILAVVLFGVLVEMLQGIVPVRQFSILDLLANAVGALLASVWFLLESHLDYRAITAAEPSPD